MDIRVGKGTVSLAKLCLGFKLENISVVFEFNRFSYQFERRSTSEDA